MLLRTSAHICEIMRSRREGRVLPMPDQFTRSKRSEIMRAVKPTGNITTELRLRALLKSNSITGWRRNYPLYGKPDFVFPKTKVALFTDGCFWHGHDCRNLTPRRNATYWHKKIVRNRKRDLLVTRALRMRGWLVVRLWECEITRVASSRLRRLSTRIGAKD